MFMLAADDNEIYDNTKSATTTRIGIPIISWYVAMRDDDGRDGRRFDWFPSATTSTTTLRDNGEYPARRRRADRDAGRRDRSAPTWSWDGYGDPDKLGRPGRRERGHRRRFPIPPEELRNCFHDNGDAMFLNFDLPMFGARKSRVTSRPTSASSRRCPRSSCDDRARSFGSWRASARRRGCSGRRAVRRRAELSDAGDSAATRVARRPRLVPRCGGTGAGRRRDPVRRERRALRRRVREAALHEPPGRRAGRLRAGPYWDFPDGTRFVKTFFFTRTRANPMPGPRLLETRILERAAKARWTGRTYVWDEAQTEALRLKTGRHAGVSLIDDRGEPRTQDYRVPNDNECKTCHAQDHVFEPLGPRTRQLNRDHDYGSADDPDVQNQSSTLRLGPASGRRAGGGRALRAGRSLRRRPARERARAYPHANCSHCHRPGGEAG